MRKFFTSGSRRYALALVIVGASLAIMGAQCQPTNPPVPTGLSISPTEHDFGNVKYGTPSSTQTFTVTSNGRGTIGDLAAPSIPSIGEAVGVISISNDSCTGKQLGAGQSCHMSATWTPLNIGSGRRFEANLVVMQQIDPSDSATATLSGQGIP